MVEVGGLSIGIPDLVLISMTLSVFTVDLIIHSWSTTTGNQAIAISFFCLLFISAMVIIFLQTKYYTCNWQHRISLFIVFMVLCMLTLFWIGFVAATINYPGDVFKPSEYFTNTWELWFNFAVQCILFLRHCLCIIHLFKSIEQETAEAEQEAAPEPAAALELSNEGDAALQIRLDFEGWNAQQNHLRRNPHMINNRHRIQKLTQSQIETLPVSTFSNRIRDPRSPAHFRRVVNDLPMSSENCLICQDMFQEHAIIRTLPCFHRFHCTCVDQWISEKATCPTCRLDLSSKLIEMQSVAH